jgi:hypothetical protein
MLQVDAKPIAHNVKILTDKAARDPSIFIRNLAQKEPPIKPMPASFGGGKYASVPSYSYLPTMVIDGEIVEVLEEIPVPVNRPAKLSMPFQLPKLNVAQRNQTLHPVECVPPHYEEAIPMPSVGRIVNVDPRYAEY